MRTGVIVDQRADLLYRVLERAFELHNEEEEAAAAAAGGAAAGAPRRSTRPKILAHMATFDTNKRLDLHRTCTLS